MNYPFALRKVFVAVEEILLEQGRASGPPVRKVAAAAVIGNPFARAYGEDLAEMMAWGTALAELIGGRAVVALGGAKPQSFGKGCIVGVDGAPEHGVDFLPDARKPFVAEPAEVIVLRGRVQQQRGGDERR